MCKKRMKSWETTIDKCQNKQEEMLKHIVFSTITAVAELVEDIDPAKGMDATVAFMHYTSILGPWINIARKYISKSDAEEEMEHYIDILEKEFQKHPIIRQACPCAFCVNSQKENKKPSPVLIDKADQHGIH